MSYRSCVTALTLVLPIAFLNAGCGGGSNSFHQPPPANPPQSTTPQMTAISVSPTTASLFVGDKQQLSVSATFTDGTHKDVTATSTWSDSAQTVATVDGTGLVNALLAGSTTITAANGSLSSSATITVSNPAPPPVQITAISVSPATVSLLTGDQQQLSVNATYSDGSQADVTASTTWTGSDQTVATIGSDGLLTTLKTGTTMVTATDGTFTSSSTITVVGPNIATWHGDNQRSGLNSHETILTPSNVNAQSFGKLFSYVVDGYVYAQPLYVSNLTMNGAAHNVVFAATENDSVYAFDADTPGDGSPLWKVSLLGPGETPVSSTSSISPEIGITSTPVIDAASNTMYVVSVQDSGTNKFFRLHALDLTSGAEKLGGPVVINATVFGTNSEAVGGVITLPSSCLQRAALLLVNNTVIIGFGSCHSGWLLSYDAQTLSQLGVFNMSPMLDGFGPFPSAGGVWMAGGGPAADADGNVYITTGNGPYDGISSFSDSAMKFDTKLNLLDHFTPFDFAFLGCKDTDLAAGGILLIPGTTQSVLGGKSGKIYVVNTANMGGSQANDIGATQTIFFEEDLSPHYSATCTDPQGITSSGDISSYEIFSTSAFFNGSVYLGVAPTLSVPAPVRQFTYSNGQLTPGSYTANSISIGSYGTTPFISANGTANGVVWMIDHGSPIRNGGTATAAVLHAYDATNLGTELYNSSQNPIDTAGFGMKFSSPIVANGKVFIGTAHDPITTPNPGGELDVYGLRN